MKYLLEYIKHSDISVSFFLNPFKWSVRYHWVTETEMDPGLVLDAAMKLGPVRIQIFIDDGRW
jgi:hypothetical protein